MGETTKAMNEEVRELLQEIAEHPGLNGARCYCGHRRKDCMCLGCRAARLLPQDDKEAQL